MSGLKKDVDDLLRQVQCRPYNCTVTPARRGGHWKVTRPGYTGCVIVSLSPSDRHVIRHIKRDLRNQLGIPIA
jgi:hypothetical protein